jgi:hypothetical protein
MPDITARQVITQALRLLGVAAAEEPVTADMAQTALESLNSLLDAWSTNRLLAYTRPKIPLALVPGQQTYSWGVTTPPCDIVGVPPVRLELCLLTVHGAQQDDWIVGVLDQAQYEAGIYLKTMQSTYPEFVYLEQTQPVKTLYVWPVPQGASHTLQLLPWPAQPQYTHWDAVLSWPNGYQRAMAYALAVEIAPEYGLEASPTVQRIAVQAKFDLAPVNAPQGRLRLHPSGQPTMSRLAAFYSGRP